MRRGELNPLPVIVALTLGAWMSIAAEDDFDPLAAHADPVECRFTMQIQSLEGRALRPDRAVAGGPQSKLSDALRSGCRACVRDLETEKERLFAANTYLFRARCVPSHCEAGASKTRVPVTSILLSRAVNGRLDAHHASHCQAAPR